LRWPASAAHAQAEAGVTPSSADPSARGLALIAEAEEAMSVLDYERSRTLAQRAIEAGALQLEALARAYRLIAVGSAQLDDHDSAEAAFRRLFALDPSSNVASRLSPARRAPVLNARGFWASHPEGFRLEVSYSRRERQVVASVQDPLGWAQTVHVWWRFGERRYVKAEARAAREQLFEVKDIEPIDALEVYAYVTDRHGNTLMQFGRERDPHLFGLSDEELAEAMRRDIRGGQLGSYGRRLSELGVQVDVHGYLSLELKPAEGSKVTFDLHHATAYVRATFFNVASVELAMEWEHLGIEADDFYLPHAFVDVRFHELLIVRGGFFEVPVGAFNEYLYPDFLRVTAQAPLMSQSVVPALWSEVGLQLRGRYGMASGRYFTYAVFVSNGLEQHDDDRHDGVVQEGGDIRAMRFNAIDEGGFDKSVGGRLGLELGEFDLGASGYTGRYTIEAKRRLSMADLDFSYRSRYVTFRCEGAAAFQETSARLLYKYGMYALLAGRPIEYLEPYAQYDLVDLGPRLQRALGGLAIYPYPFLRATRNLRLKSEAGADFPQGHSPKFVWYFQLTTGF
jgi:tetratricopeptide (TPR) repeat protein